MNRHQVFGITGVGFYILLLLYFAILILVGGPRVLRDGNLIRIEMNLFENIIFCYAGVGSFWSWVYGGFKAHSKGHTKWLLALILFFPISALYLYRLGKDC